MKATFHLDSGIDVELDGVYAEGIQNAIDHHRSPFMAVWNQAFEYLFVRRELVCSVETSETSDSEWQRIAKLKDRDDVSFIARARWSYRDFEFDWTNAQLMKVIQRLTDRDNGAVCFPSSGVTLLNRSRLDYLRVTGR